MFRLQQCFDPFAMLSLEGSNETRFFRDLSNHVFQSRYFRKYISYEDLFFFQKYLEFDIDFKNAKKKKIEHKFFVFVIIASELVALNCLY